MRLIDADEAKKLYKEQCIGDCGCCSDLQDDNTCTLIDRVPTVDDAVIVTRCKDCKYGDYDSKSDGAMVCLRTKDGFWRKETDFCSYGEYQTNTGDNDNVSD